MLANGGLPYFVNEYGDIQPWKVLPNTPWTIKKYFNLSRDLLPPGTTVHKLNSVSGPSGKVSVFLQLFLVPVWKFLQWLVAPQKQYGGPNQAKGQLAWSKSDRRSSRLLWESSENEESRKSSKKKLSGLTMLRIIHFYPCLSSSTMQQLCFFHDNPSHNLLMESQVKASTYPFIIKHVSRDFNENKMKPVDNLSLTKNVAMQ